MTRDVNQILRAVGDLLLQKAVPGRQGCDGA